MGLSFSSLGRRQTESDIARLMTMAIERPELLSLAAGFTDNETLPLDEVTELAIELGKSGDKRVLQYGTNQGDPVLRTVLSQRLEKQDAAVGYDPELSFISNGSQQALYLAVQTLCDPGDVILVEQPTYFVFLEMLRGLGVNAVSMPMLDSGDVDVGGVHELLETYRKSGDIDKVKAVYIVSYFSNPSGHSVSRDCKQRLVQLLSKFQGSIALLEDAAYRELYYGEPFKAESCLRVSEEVPKVPVFYTTTLTKSFATGLKIGFGYCSDRDWFSRMLAIKGQQDFGTSNYIQALMVKVMQSGVFDRHLERLRSSYRRKMESLHHVLKGRLDAYGWNWEKPSGGLYIWMQAPVETNTGFDSCFWTQSVKEGVLYVPGELCFADRESRNFARLSFGVLNESQLEEAGKRFVNAAENSMESPQGIS